MTANTNYRSSYILPLCSPRATLEVVGGKGASLATLVQAGLPVPGGFHVAVLSRAPAGIILMNALMALLGRNPRVGEPTMSSS